MNIFKLLWDRTGKMALSTMGAVGLSAAVGLAGVGAWQYLASSDTKNDTSFTFTQPSADVVYVAGAGSNPYQGGSEGSGSAIRTAVSDDMRLMQRDAQLQVEREAAERASYRVTPAGNPLGGPTEGLGTGQNEANEMVVNSERALQSAQDKIAAISSQVNSAVTAATATKGAAPAAEGAEPGKPAVPSLASAGRDWSKRPDGMASASGNVLNSAYAQSKGGAVNPADVTAGLSKVQGQLNTMKEGLNLRGKPNFGNPMDGSKPSDIQGAVNGSKEGKELDLVRKRSAEIANNKNRAANEGTRAFLASVKNSGGISLTDEDYVTGDTASSEDFHTPTMNGRLNGLNSGMQQEEVEEADRRADRDNIMKWMYIAIPAAVVAMSVIGYCMMMFYKLIKIPIYGWAAAAPFLIAAIAAFGLAMWPMMKLMLASAQYNSAYGGAPGKWGITIASVLIAGCGAAFLGPVASWIGKKVLPIFTKWFGLAGLPV